jgi:L-2-hydroxyglutarate oxidase LhgO
MGAAVGLAAGPVRLGRPELVLLSRSSRPAPAAGPTARVNRSFGAIVIGGGVVGLACAAALARKHPVLLLERHARMATENSARNSGVVHAGLHHPDDWLRTTLCLRGRELLYRRCRLEDVPHARTGKLIVGSASDEPTLLTLAARARDRLVTTRLLDQADLAREEPNVIGERALFVEATGIVRTSALARSLADECDARGVVSLRDAEVIAIDLAREHTVLIEGARFTAPRVVIAAGLASDRLATLAGLDVDALAIRQRFVKGTWLALDARHRKSLSRLVYPIPEADGLGVHLTLDLDGFLVAGPDAEWVDAPSFELDASREKEVRFAESLARYFAPRIDASELHPLTAGIRPRLSAPGEPARDFAICDPRAHGVAGLVVLAGIESPGLTAALAIAEQVEARLADA